VPEAAPLIQASADEQPGGHSASLPPHITLLYPFVAETAVDAALLERLARILSAVPPIHFELHHVARFPGVLYAAPEPPAPFGDLIRLLWREWPDHPPYGGAYDTIVPHLTLIEGRPEPRSLERRLAQLLPIRAEGTEIHLVVPDASSWQVLHRFPLGTAAANDQRASDGSALRPQGPTTS
jgi:2'-5' RNA ligase